VRLWGGWEEIRSWPICGFRARRSLSLSPPRPPHLPTRTIDYSSPPPSHPFPQPAPHKRTLADIVQHHEFVPGSPNVFLRAAGNHGSGEEQGRTHDDSSLRARDDSASASTEEQGRTELKLLEVYVCVFVCVSLCACAYLCVHVSNRDERVSVICLCVGGCQCTCVCACEYVCLLSQHFRESRHTFI
jgi:hypothetical protein